MNVKRQHLDALQLQKPVYIKELRVYRERGRVMLEIRPTIPAGALTWRIEGDEIVLTCNHPMIYFGHIVITKGVEIRRAFASIIRRRRSKRA